jgi:hypothetical protein
MNQNRQSDKWICCAGVIFFSAIAVAGYFIGNHDVAVFGVTGFTAFSGPLFMALNRDMSANGNSNATKNGSGTPDPTQPHS